MILNRLLDQGIAVLTVARLGAMAGVVFCMASTGLYAGGELPADAPTADRQVVHHKAVRTTKQYVEIGPKAIYARPKPAGIGYTYGTRRYAGREYLIVPGQWYPPVWEDPCTVKRTCHIPGVAPWPGVRVDLNSDEIDLAPMGPGPQPVYCGPPVP